MTKEEIINELENIQTYSLYLTELNDFEIGILYKEDVLGFFIKKEDLQNVIQKIQRKYNEKKTIQTNI